MKRNISLLLILILGLNLVFAKGIKPTKNIIVLIPDGTSLSVMSAARWLKTYRNQGTTLNIDPYISGTVTTFSSNAPIGDSAPTTSCYMTGVAQQAGNVAIYPVVDPGNDLVKLNPDSAYQPLATLLEAMQQEQKKAAGLVVTCEFPHATPADCSAHTYNRNAYNVIAPQMAFNNLEVMFGGGTSYVTPEMKKHFANTKTQFIENDKNALLNFKGERLWALFGNTSMPCDVDRDTTAVPSLAEMTGKAIEVLEKNKKGFFLMVEGSKIDWAAHANDPIAIMTEFLAFDKAVGVAMDYARRNGNTTVVIMPDHGNSGFSIGKAKMKKSYTQMTLTDLFGTVSNFKHSAGELETILQKTNPEDMKAVFKANTGVELTDLEVKSLVDSKNIKVENYMEVTKSENMTYHISKILNDRTTFGFTTGGHTGEEVFLASYHPKGTNLRGNVRNNKVHEYLYTVSGLKKPLNQLTSEIYAKHTAVFAGMTVSIDQLKDKSALLVVQHAGKTLKINAQSSVASIDGVEFDLGSVAVYVDKTNTFYLPKSLADKMK